MRVGFLNLLSCPISHNVRATGERLEPGFWTSRRESHLSRVPASRSWPAGIKAHSKILNAILHVRMKTISVYLCHAVMRLEAWPLPTSVGGCVAQHSKERPSVGPWQLFIWSKRCQTKARLGLLLGEASACGRAGVPGEADGFWLPHAWRRSRNPFKVSAHGLGLN